MARPFGTFKYRSREELDQAIDKYFKDCDAKPVLDDDGNAIRDKHGEPVFYPQRPYTIEGLALALGVRVQTLANYAKNEDYFDAIQHAREKCLNYAAERLFDKDGVQGAKFYAINNSERMGGLRYAEKQEVDMSVAPITFIDDIGL